MKTSITPLFVICFVLPCFAACPSADLTGDCRVNLADLAVLASQWLTEGVPIDGMEWVQINDPGVDGHEGFNGFMSKYEITNAQYCQFLNYAIASGDIRASLDGFVTGSSGAYSGKLYYFAGGLGYTYDGATNGGASRINWSGISFTVDNGFENHPVTYVTWYGAMAFAYYYGWCLPTEWEWQAVADYDGTFTYGCGTSINNSIANYLNSVHPDGTTVAGAFGMYGYGVCDMAGNVWEWTQSSGGDFRYLRGGCWQNDDSFCTVSYQYYLTPEHTACDVGFRVCR